MYIFGHNFNLQEVGGLVVLKLLSFLGGNWFLENSEVFRKRLGWLKIASFKVNPKLKKVIPFFSKHYHLGKILDKNCISYSNYKIYKKLTKTIKIKFYFEKVYSWMNKRWI